MTSRRDSRKNQRLPAENRTTVGIEESWEGTNEQWWDWYLSLADNRGIAPRPATLEASDLDESVFEGIRALTREELAAEMAEPYRVTEEQIQRFESDSYIRLKGVLSPGAILLLRQEALRVFHAHHEHDPSRRFSSMELMWLESEIIRDVVTGRRLGQLATDLLRVPRVRMYHDDFLCKEPGGGRTPWHYDGHHYPIASRNIATAWIPLQPTSEAMGMLELAKGMSTYELVQEIPFDKFTQEHDRAVVEQLLARNVEIDRRPFELGEISVQHCLNVHGASANLTSSRRLAYGASYFEDGARLVSSPTLVSGDWQKLVPGGQPGEPVRSACNPLVCSGRRPG